MKIHTIVAGPSANPELIFRYNSREMGDKKTMTADPELRLAGSSANVIHAVRKHGGDGLLVGLVSAHDGLLVDVMLREAVTHSAIDFVPLHLLDGTNIAVIPLDENGHSPHVLCQTHRVLPHLVSGAEAEIGMLTFDEGAYGVATGIRPGQEFFAVKLFSHMIPGHRILNFNKGLWQSPRLQEVLGSADMIVVNRLELDSVRLTLLDIHDLGPRIIVITEDAKGGFYSVGGDHDRFKAVSYPGSCTSNTGAGDWFLGTLVRWIERNGYNLRELELPVLKDGIELAAKVAGKKITMPGGAHGPGLEEL